MELRGFVCLATVGVEIGAGVDSQDDYSYQLDCFQNLNFDKNKL